MNASVRPFLAQVCFCSQRLPLRRIALGVWELLLKVPGCQRPTPNLVHDRNARPSSLASLSGHLRCGTDPEESAEVSFLGLGLKLCLAPSSLHAPPGSTSWVITPTCTRAQCIRFFVQGAWLGENSGDDMSYHILARKKA